MAQTNFSTISVNPFVLLVGDFDSIVFDISTRGEKQRKTIEMITAN